MSKRGELNVLIGSGTSARLSFLLVLSSNMDHNHVVLESIKPLSYTDEDGDGFETFRSIMGVGSITTKDQIAALLNYVDSAVEGFVPIQEGGACNFNLIQSMQNIRESNLITVYSYEKDEESEKILQYY